MLKEEALRKERDQLDGERTTIREVDDMTRNDVQHEKRKGPGATKERMQEVTRLREEAAKSDPSKKGGRRPFEEELAARMAKDPTLKERAQYKKDKLEQLLPKAYKVLETQLDHKDPRIAQMAAIKVLEWVKGKPSQTVKMDGEQVHTIRYETVAFTASGIIELPTESVRELGAGEDPEATD